MTEKDAKQLSEQEIEQVTGGENGEGGASVSWAEPKPFRLVCPVCHEKVEEVRTRIGLTWYELVRYQCSKCGKKWKKSELVKEELGRATNP